MHASYDDLQHMLASAGPAAALDRLIESLRDSQEYGPLFYALMMKARHGLGVDPIPTRPAAELPEHLHAAYEEAIRKAAREVGRLYLESGDIPSAWNYYRLIGEPEPVRAALETFQPAEDTDIYPVIELALHHGVHPRKGFELVLDRQGVCSAITVLGGVHAALAPDVRADCTRQLVTALSEQLRERLRAEIERREGAAPPAGASVVELLAGRDWLFEEDYYHIDVSHLGSVVQMSLTLPAGDPGLPLARGLCAYGMRLSPKLRYPADPPFDDLYRDAGAYLAVVAGDDADAGLEHFRAKLAAADPEESTAPAEVLVNLLLAAGRADEALAVARKHLARIDERQLSCPGPLELSRRAGDFATFAEVARTRGDAVHFLAGLLSQRPGSGQA